MTGPMPIHCPRYYRKNQVHIIFTFKSYMFMSGHIEFSVLQSPRASFLYADAPDHDLDSQRVSDLAWT